MGAAAGQAVEIVVLGDNLDGGSAVWFDCPSITGEIRKPDKAAATVSVRVAAGAEIGFHVLRLITPGGISGGIAFRVSREHTIPEEAAEIALPVAVNGRLREPGELDHYTIQAKRGERTSLEVITGNGLFDSYPGPFNTPTLAVFKAEGSCSTPMRTSGLSVTTNRAPSSTRGYH